ncbi:MAG: hypothetical protein PHR06_09390 [Candidatus Cloacimonetes bacterium]|nr:hypothetical protein [Candidatus Cloacimonadota bacterium]
MAVSLKLLDTIKEYLTLNYEEGSAENIEEKAIEPCQLERIEPLEEVDSNPLDLEDDYSDFDIEFDEEEASFREIEEPICCSPMSMSAPMPAPAQAPKRSLKSIVNNLDETFSQMLLRLIDERDLKDSYVYKKANVDRRHFSKIRNDIDYAPNKKTVIAFALALELTLDEAVDLMRKAGFAFSRSSKFDVIICYFIENREYNTIEINEVLFTYGQPILGE